MHLAQRFRVLIVFVAISALVPVISGPAHASDRLPLLGSGVRSPGGGPTSVTPALGAIRAVDPDSVPCTQIAAFNDVVGGESPGTNYDGLVFSGGMQFAERFMGQTIGAAGDFDVVLGLPTNPLILQAGAPGQNLDVFAYTGNVLAGLGPIGYPDLDAIGEGAISMYFPSPQSSISMELVGGNGGSATLSFYRSNGSLIDNVVVSGLADLTYGFGTSDGTPSISGILIQNTDASGIGVVNICHGGNIVSSRPLTWGNIRRQYR